MSEETSERLMFDSSFQRSRIYFKTLQILRISGQMIQRTRKEFQQLNPRSSSEVSCFGVVGDPNKDAALVANWDVLWGFYLQEETALLKRIADKTEEVKSLRDGVSHAQ
jgi:hypothetical protein